MGPPVFNIFMNDIMFLILESCEDYNYADDNILWCARYPWGTERITGMWCWTCNSMIWLMVWKPTQKSIKGLHFGTSLIDQHLLMWEVLMTLRCSKEVKWLAIYIDSGLTVTVICKKASQQTCYIKLAMYRTFILTNFNYYPVVWKRNHKENESLTICFLWLYIKLWWASKMK